MSAHGKCWQLILSDCLRKQTPLDGRPYLVSERGKPTMNTKWRAGQAHVGFPTKVSKSFPWISCRAQWQTHQLNGRSPSIETEATWNSVLLKMERIWIQSLLRNKIKMFKWQRKGKPACIHWIFFHILGSVPGTLHAVVSHFNCHGNYSVRVKICGSGQRTKICQGKTQEKSYWSNPYTKDHSREMMASPPLANDLPMELCKPFASCKGKHSISSFWAGGTQKAWNAEKFNVGRVNNLSSLTNGRRGGNNSLGSWSRSPVPLILEKGHPVGGPPFLTHSWILPLVGDTRDFLTKIRTDLYIHLLWDKYLWFFRDVGRGESLFCFLTHGADMIPLSASFTYVFRAPGMPGMVGTGIKQGLERDETSCFLGFWVYLAR